MSSPPQLINPYRKSQPTKVSTVFATSATAGTDPSRVPASKSHPLRIPNQSLADVSASSTQAPARPSASLPPASSSSSSSSLTKSSTLVTSSKSTAPIPTSLRSKLKKEIENLRRAKLLQAQRIEAEKQRQRLEKQRRKEAARARKNAAAVAATAAAPAEAVHVASGNKPRINLPKTPVAAPETTVPAAPVARAVTAHAPLSDPLSVPTSATAPPTRLTPDGNEPPTRHATQPATGPSTNVPQVTVTPSPTVRVTDSANHPSPSTLRVSTNPASTPMATAAQAPVSVEKYSTPAHTGTHPLPPTLPQLWRPLFPPGFPVAAVHGTVGPEWPSPWYPWQGPVPQHHHQQQFQTPYGGVWNIPTQTSPVLASAGPATLPNNYPYGYSLPPFAVPFWNGNFAPFSSPDPNSNNDTFAVQSPPPLAPYSSSNPLLPNTKSTKLSHSVRGTAALAKNNDTLCDALTVPSPFAGSYELLPTPIVVIKKPNESFGVTLQKESQSALVEPAWLVKHGLLPPDAVESLQGEKAVEPEATVSFVERKNLTKATDKAVPTENSIPPTIGEPVAALPESKETPRRRKPRRRRITFATMVIQDPTIQNQGNAMNSQSLQSGDIVIEINQQPIAGKTFPEACSFFRDCQTTDADGIICCPVRVARRKHLPLKPLPIDQVTSIKLAAESSPPQSIGPITESDLFVFDACLLNATMDAERVLGMVPSDAVLQSYVDAALALKGKSLGTLQSAWRGVAATVEQRMAQRAAQHWTEQWQAEPIEFRSTPRRILSDAQRSTLRMASRPAKGCRCGSMEHDYVHDSKCQLYSNLRLVDSSGSNALDPKTRDRLLAAKLPKDLNAVETAFKDRFVRIQNEKQAEKIEAAFVSKMEELQLAQGKAILAPSLTTMVLSAAVELQSEIVSNSPFRPESLVIVDEPSVDLKTSTNVTTGGNGEDSDEDDDVPLSALGKRPAAEMKSNTAKKNKPEIMISRGYLAKLLLLISDKWGHLYREPSDVEYAWRWEVYHGQTSDCASQWKPHAKNPRQEGSRSLENIRFVIDDSVLAIVESRSASMKEYSEAFKVLSYISSTSRTGVCEELAALLRMGVLHVDKTGIPVLAKKWYERVDLLLLEDMHFSWGTQADMSGRFAISETLRRRLEKRWTRTAQGWALNNYVDDIVFDFVEFDEWRATFEDKQQSTTEAIEGIGKFGI